VSKKHKGPTPIKLSPETAATMAGILIAPALGKALAQAVKTDGSLTVTWTPDKRAPSTPLNAENPHIWPEVFDLVMFQGNRFVVTDVEDLRIWFAYRHKTYCLERRNEADYALRSDNGAVEFGYWLSLVHPNNGADRAIWHARKPFHEPRIVR